MEEDYEKLSQKFKKEKKYDQEVRLRKEMDRVREELRELHMLIGVEGYLPYFYENTECILDYFPEESMIYLDEPKHIRERADAFYLEFSESMKSRLEGGYLLPKQASLYAMWLMTGRKFCSSRAVVVDWATSSSVPLPTRLLAMHSRANLCRR